MKTVAWIVVARVGYAFIGLIGFIYLFLLIFYFLFCKTRQYFQSLMEKTIVNQHHA